MIKVPAIIGKINWYLEYLQLKRTPLPKYIILDPINICNLKCPLCATGQNGLMHKQSAMKFETFKLIIDKFPRKRVLILSNWGEPLLNKDIFEMISYAKQKGHYVKFDTNFSVKTNEEFLIKMISSGLDEMTVSLDGCSQETYSKYKINGDFNQAFNNLTALVDLKKKMRVANPKIIWKFIVNKYNESELEKAQQLASGLGIEFKIEKIGLGNDVIDYEFNKDLETRKKEWLPLNKKYIKNDYFPMKQENNKCPFLFDIIVITTEGKVFPCCYLIDEKNTFGDLLTESLKDTWYNNKYQQSRKLFYKRKINNSGTICSKCTVYNVKG